MGKNTKPILTILIDEEKRDRLRTFAESKKLSMGKLINQLIDRAMDGDIDIHCDTSSTAQTYRPTELASTGIDRKAVEELVEGIIEKTSVGISKEIVEEWVKVSIEDISVGLDRDSIEAMIEESIARHVEALAARLDAIESGISIPTLAPEPAQVVDEILAEELTPEPPTQYSAKELADKLRITPQCLGKWRDKAGKLEALGYRADRDGRGWIYYAIESE